MLSILIQDRVARQEVERLGLPEPAALEPAALAQLQTAYTPTSGCPGSGASVLAAFPPYYRSSIRFQLDEDALAHTWREPRSTRARWAPTLPTKTAMMLACVSVIETGAKATALSLRSEILGGANFAVVAKAHSVDSTTAPNGARSGASLMRTSTPRSTR